MPTMCLHPVKLKDEHGLTVEVGCGKCRACKKSRRYQWAQRLAAEDHVSACTKFVTVTYDDEHVPYYFEDDDHMFFDVDKRDCQLFLKRLRRNFTDSFGLFKYWLVSEFGDESGRSHYHMLMFFDRRVENAELQIAIMKCWKKGLIIDVQDLRHYGGIGYLANYMYKQCGQPSEDKLASDLRRVLSIADDCERDFEFTQLKDEWQKIRSRPKSFMLASRRPAIGVRYVKKDSVRKWFEADPLKNIYFPLHSDGSHQIPLCSFLRKKVFTSDQLEAQRRQFRQLEADKRRDYERRTGKRYSDHIHEQRIQLNEKLKKEEKR